MAYLTFCTTLLFAILGAETLSPFADWAQSHCISRADQGDFGVLKSAVVCGMKLSEQDIHLEFKNLGLIHLLVVSGAHLIFLERILLKPLFLPLPLRFRNLAVQFGLILYSFVGGLQAPLVRALFQRRQVHINSSSIFLSALLTIIFFREISLSLLLSWSCALLIQWPSVRPFSKIGTSVIILLGIYPLILSLGAPMLLSAALQVLFSSFFGAIVFPATLLNTILPITELVDSIWRLFIFACKVSNILDLETIYGDMTYFPKELYVFALQIFHWRTEVSVQRKKIWKNDIN